MPTSCSIVGDNFATRHAVNRACLAHRKPLVSGAALRFDGQVSVFDLRDADARATACLFPPSEPALEAACATMGVFAPLVGMVGTVQAAEALKLLTGASARRSAGRLTMVDAMSMEWTTMRLARTPACEVCGGHPPTEALAAIDPATLAVVPSPPSSPDWRDVLPENAG